MKRAKPKAGYVVCESDGTPWFIEPTMESAKIRRHIDGIGVEFPIILYSPSPRGIGGILKIAEKALKKLGKDHCIWKDLNACTWNNDGKPCVAHVALAKIDKFWKS